MVSPSWPAMNSPKARTQTTRQLAVGTPQGAPIAKGQSAEGVVDEKSVGKNAHYVCPSKAGKVGGPEWARKMVVANTTVVFWDSVRMDLVFSDRRLPKRPVWGVPRDAPPTSPAYSPCTRSVRTVGWEGPSVMGGPIPFADHLHSVNSNRLSIQDRLSSSVKRNQLRVGLSVRVSVGLRVTGPVPIPTLHRTLSPTLRRTLSWLHLNHPLRRSHLRTAVLHPSMSQKLSRRNLPQADSARLGPRGALFIRACPQCCAGLHSAAGGPIRSLPRRSAPAGGRRRGIRG